METQNESSPDDGANKQARVGRRSRKLTEQAKFLEEAPTTTDSSPSAQPAPSNSPDAQNSTPSTATATASEDKTDQKTEEKGKFTGVSRRKQTQLNTAAETSLEGKNRKKYEDEKENTIMEIPELDEEGQEDITRVVAEAPKVRAQKVQDIAELDEASQFHLPGSDDRDIDLSLLTACLCSLDQVTEVDEVWDPDQLFTQIASELNAENDKRDTSDAGQGKQPFDTMANL